MTNPQALTSDPLNWLDEELATVERQGLRRHRRTVIPLPQGRCQIDGRELINFATNDYLGLAGHPRLIAAAQAALDGAGTGARASALLTGRTTWHQQLEERLAAFEGTESALLFPTGYAANIGAIAALVGPGDVVCGDRLNHASLIDGCRLSGATFRVYPHGDVERLDRELHKHRTARRRLIVTDGLFSMDGDVAPLVELCGLAERHQAMLLVDDAHGTGVLGEHGRGASEQLGVEDRIPIRVGTLSKAIGSQGGFVAGSQRLTDWLLNRARSQIYSTALSPLCCAAAMAALDIIESEPHRREQLFANIDRLRTALVRHQLPVMCASSAIVPVVVGDAARTMKLSDRLESQGFLVPAIRPPSVPRGTSRLRISLTAEHSLADMDSLADALTNAWTSVGLPVH